MPRAYYSTVFTTPADRVWQTIREFDRYSWAASGLEATMEDGDAGDSVGGVRRVVTPDRVLRQRLLAHSDAERSYTYEFCDGSPSPVRDYRATLRVTPVTDGDQAFVEWWATFDCEDRDRDRCLDQFEHQGFAVWLASLHQLLRA